MAPLPESDIEKISTSLESPAKEPSIVLENAETTVVAWVDGDPEDSMGWSAGKKWLMVVIIACVRSTSIAPLLSTPIFLLARRTKEATGQQTTADG